MNCDLFAASTRFRVSPSAKSSGDHRRGSMPFLKQSASSLDGLDCSPIVSYEGQEDMQWHSFQDCPPYLEESSNYQACADSYNNWYQSSLQFSPPEKTTNGLRWDYGFPHESSLQNSSSACPRSYPHDLLLDSNGCIASVTDSYPPSAYHLDLQDHTSFSLPQQRTFGSHVPTESRSDIPRTPLRQDYHQQHSPAPSQASAHSGRLNMRSVVSPTSPEGFEGVDCQTTNGDETDEDASVSSEPYAQLIYKALKSAPRHRMVLKEIYEWFEKNTDKAKNNSSKGWQNSIRHNLSMNGVGLSYRTGLDVANEQLGIHEARTGPACRRFQKGVRLGARTFRCS